MDTHAKLPASSQLPVRYLSGSFNNVTNSYKFFWFLSLLNHVIETQSRTIRVNHLLARMVTGVWYPANYFRLSFGKEDRLSQIALALKTEINLSPAAHHQDVMNATLEYMVNNTPLAREINSLGAYVPYRFLRPFFAEQLRGETDWKVNSAIRQLARQSAVNTGEPCLYHFHAQEDNIEIHPLWLDYLQEHMPIVTGFCLWHLLLYLQKNNPNVPNIAAKLFEPTQRNLRQGRIFWQRASASIGTIPCIYSGEDMDDTKYSLDHFLPWSFVTHDLLWNLIPTPKSVNSAKGDQLPYFKMYFEAFARLQFDAFQAVAGQGKERLLEDYIVLFKKQSAREVRDLSFDEFRATLNDTIAPQIQIARNMGFTAYWSYAEG